MRFANLVYDVVASILGSVRLLIPILLTILLGWFLVEIALELWASPDFQYLAFLVWLTLLIVAVLVIARAVVPWTKAWDPQKPAVPSVPPPIMPLLLWNVVLIAVAMTLADVRSPKVNFKYPLLRLYQFLFRLIEG